MYVEIPVGLKDKIRVEVKIFQVSSGDKVRHLEAKYEKIMYEYSEYSVYNPSHKGHTEEEKME